MNAEKSSDPTRFLQSREVFEDPIAYIRREHDRQCDICDQLEDMANFPDTRRSPDHVKAVRDFLAEDLNLHIDDEEEDLFPALRRRCQGHEILEGILYQLNSEHELDRGLVQPILEELDNIRDNGGPRNVVRFASSVQAFVETQRRHLSWENRVLLPLAEKHLTSEDRRAVGSRMASRRGLKYPY